ncbi:MAG: fibronectin type III domain-containing protein, partial [Planctomycetota bacterium]
MKLSRAIKVCVWSIVGLSAAGPAWAQDGNGSIVGWGEQVVGVDLSADFVAVAGGEEHSLGLKADGSIVAWGWNAWGQCGAPTPNTDFVAVAAGYGHSLGLKADGSIVAWGNNLSGQCNVPAPNTDFVAVAAIWSHSLGLKADGSIV